MKNLYLMQLEIERLKLLLLDDEEYQLFKYIQVYEYNHLVP